MHTAKTLGQLTVIKFKTNSEGIIWAPFCSGIYPEKLAPYSSYVCMHKGDMQAH